ncbi:MAG: phage holin family protein [Christensenellales bacterium]
MRELFRWVGGALGGCAAWLCWALGGWDAALGMMFLIMGLDLLSGLLASFQGRSGKTPGGGFLSSALFKGLSRKLMMLALVMLAAALDRMLGTQGISRLAVIGFYAANKGLSIVENAALLGVPFPQGVLKVLEKMKEGDKAG